MLGWRYVIMLSQSARLWPQGPPAGARRSTTCSCGSLLGHIGGRLGYVIFYNPGYFLAYPGDILAVWQGGMAFHGGLLGVIVAIIIFARRHDIPMLSLGDMVAGAVPIGLFFGRLANFINSELWGRVTQSPWGVVFPNGGPLPRHPSQLYEAGLEGLLLFVLLGFLIWRQGILARPGLTIGVFLTGYGPRVRSSNKCASPTHIWVTFFRNYYGADFVPTDDCRRHCLRCSGYAVKMSKLKARLVAQIQANGPLSLADYMDAALSDPEEDIICAARRLVSPMMAAAISPRHPKSARCSASLLVLVLDLWARSGPQPVNLVNWGLDAAR